MSRPQKWALGFAIVYLIFWMGGLYSFGYTHECVRSHQEEEAFNNEGDTRMVTVCDFYTANSKRWTFYDPVRSVATTWVTGWVDATILGGIAVAIVGFVVYDRRRERLAREWQSQYLDHE